MSATIPITWEMLDRYLKGESALPSGVDYAVQLYAHATLGTAIEFGLDGRKYRLVWTGAGASYPVLQIDTRTHAHEYD